MEIEITGIAPGGVGFADLEEGRVYVPMTIPGDRVVIGKRRRDRGRLWAECVRTVERKRKTREAPCSHFGRCGGCDWMDLPYEEQLSLKQEIVAEAFRSAGLSPRIRDIVASPQEFRYRNRVEFAFGNGKSGPIIGFYEKSDPRDRSHQLPPVCEVQDCWLATTSANALRGTLHDLLSGSRLRSYNPESRSGVLRALEIRTSEQGEDLVRLSVANDKHVPVDEITSDLKARSVSGLKEGTRAVTGFGIRVGRGRSKHAPPKREEMLFGHDRQTVHILGFSISYSGKVFSQVNAFQMEQLYRIALDLSEPAVTDVVLDLYSGVGTLSIALAAQVQHLTGIELDEGATENARENAAVNKSDNCSFVCADAADSSRWGEPVQRFDLVTVNPPRAGLTPAVIEGIASTRADRVVYVSCNPETLVRDCMRLCAHNYVVSEVHPVDMFPQTTHVESVVKLVRGGSA